MMAGLNLIGMSKKTTSATGQLDVFANASPQMTAPLTGTVPTAMRNLTTLSNDLLHLYLRYGLAVAAFQSKLADDLSEADLRRALIRAIETGLGQFRMRTHDNSLHDMVLKFEPIKLREIREKPHLAQSAGLAAQGIYLYPTLVTTDGDAGETFKNAAKLIDLLGTSTALEERMELGRSFAPTTGKINHNAKASQTPPKGTLLEAACAVVATITPLKPAVWTEQGKTILNTVISPDLPLAEVREFIAVFDGMVRQELAADLLHTRPRPLTVAAPVKKTKPAKAAKGGETAEVPISEETTSPKLPAPEFRRPQLHSGNYPDAPRDANAFGPAGLLAAIGRWARRTEQQGRGKAVLTSLADQPMHLISYDQISQVRLGHHVVRLALNHDLTRIVDSLYLGTYLYSELDSPGTPFGKPAFKTYCLMASRFLQSFTPAAFTDFLAFRAEYALEVEPLFTEYFRNMNPEIVASASAYGRWLNKTAFRVAANEVGLNGNPTERKAQIKKVKAKILVEFESAILSAKSPVDMLFRISTRSGRLLQDDAPAAAERYMEATATGAEIGREEAAQLLIAFMRLRAADKATNEAEPTAPAATPATAERNPNDDNQ